MNNPVKIDDVSNERIAYYALWGGEVFVTAQQHIGAHGFFSAALVVERCDSPMECYMYDGYDTALRSKATGGTGGLTAHTVMKQWIASKLTELATRWTTRKGCEAQRKLLSRKIPVSPCKFRE